MKKLLFGTLICSLLILAACGDNASSAEEEGTNENNASAEENNSENDNNEAELTREDEIEAFVIEVIEENINSTDITDIRVNEHQGTDDPDDFLVLIDLTWNVKNRAGTTQEMLEMYNSHIGAKLAKLEDVEEVTIFWEVPYLAEGENIVKANLHRDGENMYFEEHWFNGHIFN